MIRIENPPLHIILMNPKIPQNTGNIGRMCAIIGARLHLVRPLGFMLTDTKLKRSGMDYWNELDVVEHENWDAFKNSELSPKLDRVWLFTTKANRPHWDAKFEFGDGLLFGSEDFGCPQFVHDDLAQRRLKIPQFTPQLRSLNLATSAGIASYEAMRQLSVSGLL